MKYSDLRKQAADARAELAQVRADAAKQVAEARALTISKVQRCNAYEMQEMGFRVDIDKQMMHQHGLAWERHAMRAARETIARQFTDAIVDLGLIRFDVNDDADFGRMREVIGKLRVAR